MAGKRKPSKAKKQKLEYYALFLIFLVGLYVRLDPYLYAPEIPYGMSDAAFHYQVGKTIFEGKSLDYIWNGLGRNLRDGTFYYPPLAYYIPAYLTKLTGDFQDTVYITNAIFSALAVITSFLFVKEILGPKPALIAAAYAAFNLREIFTLFWGQWHTAYSLTFVPLILYFGVRILQPNGERNLYLFSATAALCAITYPATITFPVIVTVIYILTETKFKLPCKMKHLAIAAMIFLIIASPMLPSMNMLAKHATGETPGNLDLNAILSWYPKDFEGTTVYPKEFYDPTQIYSIWGLALIIIGAATLIQTRNKEGRKALKLTVIMAVTFYALVHATLPISHMRAIKLTTLEPIIFILAFSAATQTKNKKIKTLAWIITAVYAINYLMTLPGLGELNFPIGIRPTPNQMEALYWIKNNTGEHSTIIYQGFNGNIIYWATAISERRVIRPETPYHFIEDPINFTGERYILLDEETPYKDPAKNQQITNVINEIKQTQQNITRTVYNKSQITILKYAYADQSI